MFTTKHMITRAQQYQILESLERLLSITDVYFHKGVLYVVNDYDLTDVAAFMDETGWARDVEFRSASEEESML